MIVIRQPTSPFHSDFLLRSLLAAHSAEQNEAATESSRCDGEKSSSNHRICVRPASANVDETETHYEITVDLPGVKSADIELKYTDDQLVLSALRKDGDLKYVRQFSVNHKIVDVEGIAASYDDGVLSVQVPKKEKAGPIDVPIVNEDAPSEISEENKELRLTLDLPGVKMADLRIVVANERLLINGVRKRGRFASKIQRQYPLDVDRVSAADARAYLMDGVLVVTAPLKEVPKIPSRSIEVAPKSVDAKPTAPMVASADEAGKEEAEATKEHDVIVETAPEEEANEQWESVEKAN